VFLSVTLGIPFHDIWLHWSAAEILLYQCYYRLHPWGDERDDIRVANQTNFVAAATGVKKRGGGEFTIQDFMPFAEKSQGFDENGDPIGLMEAFKAMSGRK
jgi:hypothetical protein